MKEEILYGLVTILYLGIVFGSPVGPVTQSSTNSKDNYIKVPQNTTYNNKTIEELVKQQTENVKKIVEDQKQQIKPEYPIITKLEPQYSEEAKKQIEKLSIEELKIKCQHLSKLFNTNRTNENSKLSSSSIYPDTSTRLANHKPNDSQKRPVYVQGKPTYKPKLPTTPKPNGFYITTQNTAPKNPPTNSPATPVKYIRLEPVILQKTILSDGRTVYYWHRSLPTAVEFANDPAQNNQISSSPDNVFPSYSDYVPPIYNSYSNTQYGYGNVPYGYAPLPHNAYISTASKSNNPYQNTYYSTTNKFVDDKKPSQTTTESTTTSTTESSYTGYSFGSFLPFYSLTRQDSTTTTTTEPTTTTTTTTPEPTTEKLNTDDLLYAQQLRFVIPVPYENVNSGTGTAVRHPWDFDQYAYYPKELQPNTMNVQVPYTPTFHMIRAVAVPNSDGNLNDNVNHKI